MQERAEHSARSILRQKQPDIGKTGCQAVCFLQFLECDLHKQGHQAQNQGAQHIAKAAQIVPEAAMWLGRALVDFVQQVLLAHDPAPGGG